MYYNMNNRLRCAKSDINRDMDTFKSKGLGRSFRARANIVAMCSWRAFLRVSCFYVAPHTTSVGRVICASIADIR